VRAEILTIGDELLRGEIIDSNKARIAQRLLELDIEPRHQASVCDDRADMTDAFRRAAARADVVLVSGGLGPTRDDLTTEVLAATWGRPLERDEASLEAIRAFFARVGREMRENNAKQALFPRGAEVLPNPVGTAPGFALEVPAGEGAGDRGCVFFCMPGVPRELDLMMDEQVLPRLARRREALEGHAPVLRARLLRTFGQGESSIDHLLADLAAEPDVEIGFRTAFPDNYVRPVARAATAAAAEKRLAELEAAIRARLGDLIYGEGDDTLEVVVGRLLEGRVEGRVAGRVAGRGRTIATAESCTGGLVAQKITDVPGSSAYFLGGVVAYSNEAKQALLGVPEPLLVEHGAVSRQVALAMARGARERFGASVGVATTGISGPGGGSAEKPVGLVHVAIDAEGGEPHSDHFVLALDRSRHRVLTAQIALDWVRRRLLGVELISPDLMRRAGGGSVPGRS